MAAKKKPTYGTNGAAAYDIYSTRFDSNAVRKADLPQELPRERTAPVKKKKVKAKAAVAPFAVVGSLVVACLLIMVVYGYVQLYDATSQVGALNSQLTQVQEENAKLRSSYESSINLTKIEEQAQSYGMRQPTSNQKVYLNISGTDKAEVLQVEKENAFQKVWQAIRDSFTGLVEYFL